MTNYEHEIDPIILNSVTDEWETITTVISRVFDHPEFNKDQYAAADVAERIYILVDSGKLNVEGNMRRWRNGKVKAKA